MTDEEVEASRLQDKMHALQEKFNCRGYGRYVGCCCADRAKFGPRVSGDEVGRGSG